MPPCFNPRPTRRQGATRRTSRGYLHPAPFQSSPPPKAGRNVALVMVVTASRRFNPRPTRRQGATQGPAERGLRLPRVSILAPPEGRAQHRHERHLPSTRFVSILAPPEGRAQHSLLTTSDGDHVAFQSSPHPKAGRNSCAANSDGDTISFQSSPHPK